MQKYVTVIGGTGFIGRRLVRRLLARQKNVRIVARSCSFRPDADVNEGAGLTFVTGDITDEETAINVVDDSWAVINLVGTTRASTAEEFYCLHDKAPTHLARLAKANGIRRFIHFSAMGVSATAPAVADRSKAAGEAGIIRAFPNANIVRPSLIYGRDDHFFSRFVSLIRRAPVVPLVGGGRTRFEPMHADDLADAVIGILTADALCGRDFDLGGPEVLSFRELLARLAAALGKKSRFLPIPFTVAELGARCIEHVPGVAPTSDRIRLLRTDKIRAPGAGRAEELGTMPRPISDFFARFA